MELGEEPPSRYPPVAIVTENDAVTLEDIKPLSAARATYMMRRLQKRSGCIVVCESKYERDDELELARQKVRIESAMKLYGTVPKRFNPLAAGFRFYRTRFAGRFVEDICCTRCRNASRLFYNINQKGAPPAFQYDKETKKWKCRACVAIESELARDPRRRLLSCRLLDVRRHKARRLASLHHRHLPLYLPDLPPRWAHRTKPCRLVRATAATAKP